MTQPNPQVSIHLVTWNGMTHIPSCVSAVQQQTYRPVDMMVVDNGSVDGTVKWLMSEHPEIHLLRNTRNLGFCRGHNQAIRLTEAPFVLCLNQDVVLTPTWLAQAMDWMEQRPEIGAVGGKLLRYEYTDEELKNVTPSDIIDSAGLQIYRTRHVVDRGIGQADHGSFLQPEAVFGLSGACVLFRRTALDSIRYQDEYFDEDFFAYKDDVDLSWRLLRQGWLNWYDGGMIAYHHRSIRGTAKIGNIQIAKNFQKRDVFNATYSYRNHWLLLMKHESWSSIWRDLPWVLWYEIRKFIFLLFTKPTALVGWQRAWKLRRQMKKKSQLLDNRRGPKYNVRPWFLHHA